MQHFTTFDNLDLAYLALGEGEPVILLHGFAADHSSNWVATGVVDSLVEAGRRVFAPDARATGSRRSRTTPARTRTTQWFAIFSR